MTHTTTACVFFDGCKSRDDCNEARQCRAMPSSQSADQELLKMLRDPHAYFDSFQRAIVAELLERFSKEAERYRWMRENDWDSPIIKLGYDEYQNAKGAELDAAVDAAIASK